MRWASLFITFRLPCLASLKYSVTGCGPSRRSCFVWQLNMQMALEWIPRDQNEEADALTNEEFTGFTPSLRLPADPSSLRFRLLSDLLPFLASFLALTDAAKDARRDERRSAAARAGLPFGRRRSFS